MTTSWAITSAMRKSRKVSAARSTAALAASFQDFVLVPISSMTLYTLSGMAFLLEPSNSAFAAAGRTIPARLRLPSYAQERPLSGPFGRPRADCQGPLGRAISSSIPWRRRDAAEQTHGGAGSAPHHFEWFGGW